jgi:hypothetical protein
MALTQIDFDSEEEEYIKKVMEDNHVNKPRAVKIIVMEKVKDARTKN